MIKPSSSTAKTVEYEDIKLAKVFVGDEERARGYIVTDKKTEEFLYFADVDRQEYKLTTFDVEKNEILIKENINQLQEWATSNKLDLMKLLEEYQAQVNSGNQAIAQKFWGNVYSWGACGPNSNGDGGYSQGLYVVHYAFWIPSKPKVALDDDNHQIKQSCTP